LQELLRQHSLAYVTNGKPQLNLFMTDDQTFRLIFLAWLISFMPIGIWHRLKSRTGEKLDRRQEGLFILVALRLTGVVSWIGLIAYLINPDCMAWAAASLPTSLRWAGVALVFVAGCLVI
jgi:hypothetical protein